MPESVAPNWAGPLQGIRVLDFTRVLAGPAASLALADLGAEVVKVEPPETGDETRLFPPFRDDESHYFLSVNRGKKSIVVDLKSDAGVALVKDLAAKCDILIENYRPGVMDRLGLGYEILSAINPRLIYCAISGYGMTGPLRDRPSFDIVLQAMSGALSVNGEPGATADETRDSAGRSGGRDQRPDRHIGGAARAQRHRARTFDRRQPVRWTRSACSAISRNSRSSRVRIRSLKGRNIRISFRTAYSPRRTGRSSSPA